jgi:replicative DNA helicase
MNTVAARPGCGKTAFAIQIMKEAALRDEGVVYWSYEMGFDQIAGRLLANLSGEDVQHFKKTGLGDVNKIATAASQCTRLPIIIEDKTLPLNRVRSMARRMAREHNVKLFIIDYLQIITQQHCREGLGLQQDHQDAGNGDSGPCPVPLPDEQADRHVRARALPVRSP